MRKWFMIILFGISTFSSSGVFAGEFGLIVNLGSKHFQSGLGLNEFNPGLAVEYRQSIGASRYWEIGAEAGMYLNSYEELTKYGLVSIDREVLEFGDENSVRVGIFAGFFEYSNVVDEARLAGVPTIDDYVFIPGLTAELRFDGNTSLKLKLVPGTPKSSGLVTFQLGLKF